MTTEDYIACYDAEFGESWSDDTDQIIRIMKEYAKSKIWEAVRDLTVDTQFQRSKVNKWCAKNL